MTPDAFRVLALAFPGAVEKAHLGNPDFRVKDKIFATVGGASGRAVVKLTPEEQDMLTAAEPAVFSPSSGAWGRRGWTYIALEHADEALAQDALTRSYRNVTTPRSRR